MNPLPVPANITTGTTLSPAARARISDALLAAKSESTRRNYRNDWERFTHWCDRNGHQALPADPNTLADYITEHAEQRTNGKRLYALATIRRWKATINYIHRATGNTDPVPGDTPLVRETFAGLTRLYARQAPRPPRKRAALLLDPLRTIVTTARTDAHSWQSRTRERRDSAILLIGWAAALRRSEITALTPRNFAPRDTGGDDGDNGFTVTVDLSKTDQSGLGQIKILPTGSNLDSCAPCALIRWLEVLAAWNADERAGLMRDLTNIGEHTHHVCSHERFYELIELVDTDAPLIRAISRNGLLGTAAPDSVLVHRVIRERAAAAGFEVEELGGHSLRAGFVTEGFRQGAAPHDIKQQTGHTSDVTLAGYARHITVWDTNAANTIGM